MRNAYLLRLMKTRCVSAEVDSAHGFGIEAPKEK